jgi:hypothetical protein
MPKLTGIFSGFLDLDQLSADDLNHWLKAKENPFYLENYIGDRILYPQAIPVSLRDLEIDLAILREYLRRHPEIVYNSKTKKMFIPEELEMRFPPLQKLVGAILDVIVLSEPTPIIVRRVNNSVEIVGTIISYTPVKEGFTDVNINGQTLKLETETVTILPSREEHVVAQIAHNNPVNVAGGSLGIVIDLRKAGS